MRAEPGTIAFPSPEALRKLDALRGQLDTVRSYIRAQIGQIPEGCLRLENPHTYPVGVTTRLAQLRDNLVRASRRKALLAREESLAG